MTQDSNETKSNITDKYISEYNQRLKKERDFTVFDSELNSENNVAYTSTANNLSTWKSDFGRSLDQLERAFSSKRHELDLLNKKIASEKQELEKLYKFKVNVVNLNNVIRFLNEKSQALSNEFEEKKLSLSNDFNSLNKQLVENLDSEKEKYNNLLEELKVSFDERKSLLQSDITLFEDQMKKRKDFWESDKNNQLNTLQEKKLIFYDEKNTISEQLNEENALINFNLSQLTQHFNKLQADTIKKKYEVESELDQIQIDYVKKYDDYNSELNEISITLQDQNLLSEELTMLNYEADFIYSYKKALINEELNTYEASVKHNLREQLIAMRDMHDNELKKKEDDLYKKFEDFKLNLENEFQEKHKYMEVQFNQDKSAIENEKRSELKREFDYLLSFEKEKYEKLIKSQDAEILMLKDNLTKSVSEKDLLIKKLTDDLSFIKTDVAKLKVENENLTDNARKSTQFESEDRYQSLLHSYRKKHEIELNRSKQMISSIEKELNTKTSDLVKSNMEIKKLQNLLNKYMSNNSETRSFLKFDKNNLIPNNSDKVIRANSYDGT